MEQHEIDDVRNDVLAEAVKLLGESKRRAILAEFTRRRVGMRHSETPGHTIWYPVLVDRERLAAELLGLPQPALRT
jgi:hypothetical protein